MKAKLIMAAFLCCVALTISASAQTAWAYSDLQFNGCDGHTPTKICGIGSIQLDYTTQAYYNMQLYVKIVDVQMWPNNYDLQVYSVSGTTSISGTAEVNYSSTHEYFTEMQPVLGPMARSDDGVYYRDYYNFAYFNSFPVLWPAAGGLSDFMALARRRI